MKQTIAFTIAVLLLSPLVGMRAADAPKPAAKPSADIALVNLDDKDKMFHLIEVQRGNADARSAAAGKTQSATPEAK